MKSILLYLLSLFNRAPGDCSTLTGSIDNTERRKPENAPYRELRNTLKRQIAEEGK
jgi:hypothetical protein